MKIVVQHPHRRGEISGVLTSVEEMMPELLARPGIEVRLLSTRECALREQLAAVWQADAVLFNSNCLLLAIAARLLFKRTLLKLHYLQYQTVHMDYVRMSFRQRMAAELRHLRGLRSGPRYFFESVARLVLRTISAFVVHRVCACSGFVAEQCALPRKVPVLRNPIRVAQGLSPLQLSSLEDPRRFVFIGRVTRDKGWDTLVEAASQVARTGRDFRIDVIGDGADLQVMKECTVLHGVQRHFRFAGRLDPERTKAALPGALAALMPSRFQEPAGYIPLEAAAHRVACIVSRVGGLPETAGPDCPTFSAGHTEELAQLMIRFLDEPSTALAAGYAAYLRVQGLYSPRVIVDELIGMLQPRHSGAGGSAGQPCRETLRS